MNDSRLISTIGRAEEWRLLLHTSPTFQGRWIIHYGDKCHRVPGESLTANDFSFTSMEVWACRSGIGKASTNFVKMSMTTRIYLSLLAVRGSNNFCILLTCFQHVLKLLCKYLQYEMESFWNNWLSILLNLCISPSGIQNMTEHFCNHRLSE